MHADATDRPNRSAQAPGSGAVHSTLLHADLPRPALRAPAALQPALRRAHQRIYHDARGRSGRALARTVASSSQCGRQRGTGALHRYHDRGGAAALSLLRRAQSGLFPSAIREQRALLLRSAMDDTRTVRSRRARRGPAYLRALVPHGHGGIINRAGAGFDPKSLDCARRDRAGFRGGPRRAPQG